MREKHVCKMVLAVLFLVLFSFGLSWAQNPPTMLVIVRAADDSLWKMTCDEGSCSAFTSFPGMFRYQPTVTWDETAQEWVLVGTASNNTIWMSTFNKQGNFNNDWAPLPGSTPSPAGASGSFYDTLRNLICSSGQIPKWNGVSWVCTADETGSILAPSSTVPSLDGSSSAGASANYSRGDHKHGITTGAIGGAMIADGAISTAKIGDGQVTNPKITGPIDGSKISSAGLNADTVDGQHASNFASASHNHDTAYVNEGQANSIISAMIVDGTIMNADISDSAAIGFSKLSGVAAASHNHVGEYWAGTGFDVLMLENTGGFDALHAESNSADSNHAAVYAVNAQPTGYAGMFLGNVRVSGDLSTAAKTRHWSVRGGDFVPNDETNTYSKSDGRLFATTGTFNAPLHLPDGATVTNVRIRFLDYGSWSFTVFLGRQSLETVLNEVMATYPTPYSPAWQTHDLTTITNPVIDNLNYAYFIQVNGMDGSTNHILGAVVITYTVTVPLP